MNQLLYDIITTIGAGPAAAWLALSQKRRPLLARFSAPNVASAVSPIWVHACSVGELGVARPVIEALLVRHSDTPVVLTVSTRSGWEMARQLNLPIALAWFPVDQRAVVSRFFYRVRPRVLVLMETEIWPNVLREAQRTNVPVLVLNGRISDKHFARYQRFPNFFRAVFSRITAAGVQREQYANRFNTLGVDRARITITGNIKFDNLTTEINAPALESLRNACGIPDNAPVIVFGSTRPGDEMLAAKCWQQWKTLHPELRMVVAPRHPHRLGEALAPFTSLSASETRDSTFSRGGAS